MLSFKKYVKEVAEPKPEGEKNFKRKHTDNIDKKDHPVAKETQFSGGKEKDRSRKADRSKGEDEAVYEETEDRKSWSKIGKWHKPNVKKDKYGNVIKDKNMAKHLAKKAKEKSSHMDEEIELDESVIADLQKIVKNKQMDEVTLKNRDTLDVDLTTASALVKVYGALDGDRKKKFEQALEKNETMFMKMVDFAFSHMK